MVEDVEELCPELHRKSFHDRGPLEYGEVKIDDALLPERSIYARFVTKGPGIVWCINGAVVSAGRGKASRIEPLRNSGNCASRYVLIAARNVVGPERTDP